MGFDSGADLNITNDRGETPEMSIQNPFTKDDLKGECKYWKKQKRRLNIKFEETRKILKQKQTEQNGKKKKKKNSLCSTS
jgi:hypothetical protein